MPHFHVPLQSGSPALLRKMRRRYTLEEYADRINQIKTQMPHAAIGADVIVGFPGETDAAFQETVEFLQEQEVSYLHVFTYSEREDTDALQLPNPVPQRVRNERNKHLRNLSFRKEQHFESTQQGQTRWVLFETANREGMMEGYTDNYIRVKTPYREEWKNTLVHWTL